MFVPINSLSLSLSLSNMECVAARNRSLVLYFTVIALLSHIHWLRSNSIRF